MSQLSVNSLKPGITFEFEGELYVVITAQHSKQARSAAIVKAKLKNLREGTILIKTFNPTARLNKAYINKRLMSFLYADTNLIFLIDSSSYEQLEISRKRFEREVGFLKEGANLMVRSYADEVIGLELPLMVELKVVYSPPAVRGNTSTTPTKRVKLETGLELEVPIFIEEGDIITINTEEGKYVSRQNKTNRF